MKKALPVTDFAARCQEALEERWPEDARAQAKAAKAISERIGRPVKSQTIQYLCSKAKSSELTIDLAAVTGVEYLWLKSGQQPKKKQPTIAPISKPNADAVASKAIGDLVFVDRVVGAHLSAGAGEALWDFDQVEKSHAFRLDWMQKKGLRDDKCVVWSVRGDSMEPRYRNGDVVLIDMRDREPRHSKIYALIGEDGLRIKQLRTSKDGWVMHSFNPDQDAYPPEPIVEDNYAIIGRVRWHAGDDD